MPTDARTEKKLATVEPEMARRVRLVLEAMDRLGLPMTVTDGKRTVAQQQALYAQGRTKPGKKVTDADGVRVLSNHQSGRAVDCTFLNEKGQPHWPETPSAWAAYGAAAKAVGLLWGGDWKDKKGRPKPDNPHVELPK